MLTLINLLLGCISIVAVFENKFEIVPYLVIGAAVADFFDGFVARLLKVNSPLGVQLDSLADMVTFGVVPGCIMYHLLILIYGSEAWYYAIPAFSISLFSALRLAKFNIDTRQSTGFIGLPTPANTLFIISLIFLVRNNNLGLRNYVMQPTVLYAITAVTSYLLVCELPMFAFKFKQYTWQGNQIKFIFLAVSALLLAVLGGEGLFVIVPLYILSSVFAK